MNEVKLFGSNSCVYCLKLKNLLIKNNVEHEFILTDTAEGLAEFKEVFGVSGVDMIPQVAVNGHLLIPTKSFSTIEQAYEQITKLIKK